MSDPIRHIAFAPAPLGEFSGYTDVRCVPSGRRGPLRTAFCTSVRRNRWRATIKTLGAYFTPEAVADALVRWVVRDPADSLLDPASGDGRFVARHPNSVGVERDPISVAESSRRAPEATIIEDDFFTWAAADRRRFDCAAGNPPFIRYQRFAGATRRAATTAAAWASFSAGSRRHGRRSSSRRAASCVRAGGWPSSCRPRSVTHRTPVRSWTTWSPTSVPCNWSPSRTRSSRGCRKTAGCCWPTARAPAQAPSGCRESSDSTPVRRRRRCRRTSPWRLGVSDGAAGWGRSCCRRVFGTSTSAWRPSPTRSAWDRSRRSASVMSAAPMASSICVRLTCSASRYPTSSSCRRSGTAGTSPVRLSTTPTSSAGWRRTNRYCSCASLRAPRCPARSGRIWTPPKASGRGPLTSVATGPRGTRFPTCGVPRSS